MFKCFAIVLSPCLAAPVEGNGRLRRKALCYQRMVMAAGPPRIQACIEGGRGLHALVSKKLLDKCMGARFGIEDDLRAKMAEGMWIHVEAHILFEVPLDEIANL